MNKQELTTVAEDLVYLRDHWDGKIATPEIRRGSALLRRILVEDEYGRAWRTAGFKKEPCITAIDLTAHAVPADTMIALALGVHLRGLTVFPAFLTPSRIGSNGKKYIVSKDFALSDFLKSPSGYLGQKPFNRREVIKYIAYLRQGVHPASSKMRKAEKKLAELSQADHEIFRIDDVHGLYLELLAIGQAVGRSKDTATYIQRVLNL